VRRHRPALRGERDERGFTLVEVAVALAILGGISVAVFTLLANAQSIEARGVAMADLRSRARTSVDRIARELRGGRVGASDPANAKPLGSASVTVEVPTGTADPLASGWGSAGFRLADAPGEVYGNGLDDDGDGLPDQRNVVAFRAGDPDSVVAAGIPALAKGESANGLDDNGNGLVDEGGLWFAWDADGYAVSFGLTLERRIKTGEVLSWYEETTVRLRNN
jgi:prepilin-type N-terminal cleavage/methylation domain-containing protein